MVKIGQKTTESPKVERLTVSAAEAAMMLGVSERTLWKWTKEGRIPFVKIERRVLYSVEMLRQFVNGKTDKTKTTES